jgi:hypothetical protein
MSADVGATGDWSDEVPENIVKLAEKFGIADAEALEDALGRAVDAVEEVNLYNGVMVQYPEDGGEGMSSERSAEQHARLLASIDILMHELNIHSGLTYGADVHFLKEDLTKYRAWLASVTFRRPAQRRSRPVDELSRAFVLELARAWQSLAGRRPTAWREAYSGQAGGDFYSFLQAAWEWHPSAMLPWIKFPSASTVDRWIDQLT